LALYAAACCHSGYAAQADAGGGSSVPQSAPQNVSAQESVDKRMRARMLVFKAEKMLRTQPHEAVKAILAAKALAPELASIQTDLPLGEAYYQSGQFQEAVNVFVRVLCGPSRTIAKIETEDGQITFHKLTPTEQGNGISIDTDQFPGADISFVEEGDSTFCNAPLPYYFHFAVALGEIDQWEKARRVYHYAVRQLNYTNNSANYNVLQEDRFEANDFIQERLLSAVHASLGMYEFKGGDHDVARSEFLTALRLNRHNVCANFYMGELLKWRHRDKEAAPYFEAARAYGGRRVSAILDQRKKDDE
jgi:tetratricopeptide (TPR) repeat protein